MPLPDLQSALGTLVAARAAGHSTSDLLGSLGGLDLTADERGWLAGLTATPGFGVTCHIQRWWRETRLRWTARLTLAALGPARGAEAINDYLAAAPCPSLFFMPEAFGFLDSVARTADENSHAGPVARFERALLALREATARSSLQPPDSTAAPRPAAALVEFFAPPVELLGALLAGAELPPVESERFPVIVAPGLPHFWRPATREEARAFCC
jgi:hypothetical protein